MRVIGMISGTSFDAVEALLADLHFAGAVAGGDDDAGGIAGSGIAGDEIVVDLIEHRSVPYPAEVAGPLAALLPPAPTTIEAVCRLDVAIGKAFAEVAGELAEAHGGVEVVCAHGQTVFHWVEGRQALGTLQLGEAAWIAERTGAAVVSDVRNRDIAAGGQGAPLASLLDVLLAGSEPPEVTGFLNLGGIANVTVVAKGRDPIAFDLGPANALIDAAVHHVSGGARRFDRDGALAAAGTVRPDCYARLLEDPYYRLDPPKSTGKEHFNLAYLLERLGPGESLLPEDLVATVTAATAEVIANDLRRLEVADVVASGGGTRNPVLMRELRERLGPVRFRLTDELGVPEAAKEALIFAVVGFLTVNGLPATIPSCTGASRPSILGSITPGRAPLRTSSPMLRRQGERPMTPPGERPTAVRRLTIRTPLSAPGAR